MDENFDFDGIELTLPTTLFDDRYVLNLDGTGDLLFNQSTPMGWVGSYQQFSDAYDRIIELSPATIVPGHGPVCGLEAAKDEQAYFQHVLDESRKCFAPWDLPKIFDGMYHQAKARDLPLEF